MRAQIGVACIHAGDRSFATAPNTKKGRWFLDDVRMLDELTAVGAKARGDLDRSGPRCLCIPVRQQTSASC